MRIKTRITGRTWLMHIYWTRWAGCKNALHSPLKDCADGGDAQCLEKGICMHLYKKPKGQARELKGSHTSILAKIMERVSDHISGPMKEKKGDWEQSA